MKKIILFSLLALTACKKDKIEKSETTPTIHTIQVIGTTMLAELTINGVTYYNPNEVKAVYSIKTGEIAKLYSNGADPTDYRSISFMVDGKVYKTYSGNGPVTIIYTAN